MTKKAMKLLDDVLNMLVAYQMTGQEPQELISDRMSAMVVKVAHEDLAGNSFSIGGGTFGLPSSDITASWADEECFIVAKVLDIVYYSLNRSYL